MLVAVEETATATGRKNQGETAGVASAARPSTVRFPLRHTAFGVWVLAGTLPVVTFAQVVADPNAGAHQPTVIQTASGIQQVNITRPSGAGVSINGYTQFDVPKAGVILNNSPTIVQTQQAGFVNGNANLLPGQAAKIIINQVNSNSPSQLRGYVEVAGSRAEVVIANSSGLVVDGAGFINTSRAVLTTGTPLIGANGNLTGFNVTGGQITVQGAGLNAANVDQVDLIARAVAVNASIYANGLNVVTGANQVDHDTLAATAIAGSGAAPGVSIDVSQLGGMYANRIRLVGTENGVGVSLRGVTAAQAGDLTLTTQGKLVLQSTVNASGNISLAAQGGIDNSGTLYGQQAVSASTAGNLTNSGTLAAQQGLTVSASNVTSTGTLGAGINADGSVGAAADMSIVAANTLSATGRNTAAGNASLQAGNISLTGSQTGANGNVTLNAHAGDLDLTGATVSAGGSLDVTAQGALANSRSSLTSQGAVALESGGAFNNAQGLVQAGGALTVTAGSLDNTAGRVVSLNADGLTIATTDALTNVAGTTAGGSVGGVIGGNGVVQLSAGTLTNHGQISAQGDGRIRAQAFDNGAGSTQAGGTLDVAAAGALSNAQGAFSAADTLLAAGSLDNGAGRIEGNHVGIAATGGLSNRAGTITQFGTSDTAIVAGGLLDNTSGSITSNGANLKFDAGSLTNDSGTISHAGSGTLTVSGVGKVSNANGSMATNGALSLTAGGYAGHGGTVSAQGDANVNVQGALDNTSGTLHAGNAMSVSATGDISNGSGLIESAGTHAALTVSGANIDNTGGRMASAGDGTTSVSAQTALTNGAQGFIGGNGDVALSAATLTNAGKVSAKGNAQLGAQQISNDAGSVLANGDASFTASGALTNRSGTLSAGGTTTLNAGSVDNSGGKIESTALALTSGGDLLNVGGSLAQYGTSDQQIQVTGKLDNTGGTIASNGANLGVNAGSLVNDAGQIAHAGSGTLTIASQGAASNTSGSVATNGALSLAAATLASRGGRISAQGDATIDVSGALDNTGGTLHAGNSLDVDASGNIANAGGRIEAAGAHGALTVAGANVDNTGGRVANAGDGTTRVTSLAGLTNGSQGFIGGNGDVSLAAASLTNAGTVSAKRNTDVTAQTVNSSGGALLAGGDATVTATGAFSNRSGTLSAGGTGTVNAGSIDNSAGSIDGTALSLTSGGDLVNAGGSLTQYGTADQRIQVTGTLDNTAGTIASNAQNLTITDAALVNDRGTVQHAGTGTLGITTTGAMSNVSGKVGTNGTLAATVDSLTNTGSLAAQQTLMLNAASGANNRGGALYGQSALSVTTHGQFDNTSGSAQTAGDLSVQADGALTNAQGTLSANGAHGTVNVSAATVDNSSGHLTNAGDGATTVSSAGSVNNAGGTLGGNGDVTVNASDLTNTSGAQLVSGGALNANVTRSLNNAGGRIYGGTALTLNQTGATLRNDGGTLLGGRSMSMKVALFSNQGGVVRANQDIGASGAMSGNGEMTAGGNLTLNVAGDYTNTAANRLHADGDMALNASGTLTNTGTLGASGALTVSGANVVNAAGADINSASTTVNASGVLNNAGRIEGDTVHTNSALLANTGAVIGNVVQVNANDVQNTGAAAVIAAAQDLKIYGANSVSNTDGALIYSAGNLEIARDGTRDGSGFLADQTNVLTNSSADIEADGTLDIAAHNVNNVRTTLVTQAGTPQDAGTQTLTLWTAGIPIGEQLGSHLSGTFSQWAWSSDEAPLKAEIVGKLATPISVTVPKSQVANLNTSAQTFSLTQPLTENYTDNTVMQTICNSHDFCSPHPAPQTRNIATNPTQWYNSITDNGSTYTITFWPDFDPNKNIRPDQVKTRFDLGSDSHDYSETQRTTTTTTTTDQLIAASATAKIQAQGAIRINADGGSINNQSSTMAAGGNLIRRAAGGSVNDTGIVLEQTVTQDEQSTFYWHQKTGGSSDTKVVEDGVTQSTTTVAALPAIATSNQGVQTDAQTINVSSVNRLGQTVTGSGVMGGNANGTQLGTAQGAAGQAETVQSGATLSVAGVPGQAGGVQPVLGAVRTAVATAAGQTARPQTLGAASGGIPNLTLPGNGLYTLHPAPAQPYLVATDPRFTQYNNFISSDYMLDALDLDPSKVQKRLGDGAYEEKLVRDQVTQLTGRTFLTGYSDNMDEYKSLMNAGVAYSKAFGLTPGIGLTDAQMQQLTTDMVWLVSQDVTLPDGTHQSVLVPKLYLAEANAVDLQHTGALVAGNTVSLHATGDVNNTGHIVSDVATQILGNTIVNSGVIGSAGTTTVAAVEDVRNVGGRIGGGDVVVQAGRDVVNETQTIGVTRSLRDGDLTSTVTGTGVGSVASISATGSVAVLAGRDLTMMAANVQAGTNALIGAGRDINVGTMALKATQDVGTADGLNGGHDVVTKNAGSTITAGGSLTTVSGHDTTITDATVKTGGDVSIIAGNNLTVTAAKDTHTHSEQSLGGSLSHHTSSSYDEAAQGSDINASGEAVLAAGQSSAVSEALGRYGISTVTPAGSANAGNLSVLGSSVTTGSTAADGSVTGGGLKLVATGDVNIGAVTETHDAQSWSHTDHSGFMSSDQTTDQKSSHQVNSVGSTVAGDTVSAVAGHDLVIAGSTVASTNDMALSAGHDLTVTTTQDTSQSSHFHEEQKSGLGGTGGAGISYGSNDTKETTHDSSVTQNSSLVGSTNGSVTMTAGNNLHITGSDVIAAQDVTGKAANVAIDATTGTSHHDDTQETKTSGFTLGMGGSVGDAINSAIQQTQAASNSQDGRAKALHAIAAVGNAGSAVGSLAGGGAPDVSVQLSYGTSQSKNTFTEDQTTQTGSTVKAGGTASFIATGGGDQSGQAGNGNVTIAGSDVTANNVVLNARNQVNLVNTTNTDTTRSTNESSSASVGVSYGTKGFGVSASMSKAHGDANSDVVTQNNTHVTARNNLSIVSGGDTNIVGSDVSGNHVSANVGGNLNIASVQDTTVSSAHQSSTSGGFSISQGGGSASFSSQHGSANGNYATVTEQAGIQAGSGGFDITVKGNTDLKGAYIASDADPSKNTLTTGTLTYSDIQNHSDYSSSTSGFSAGTSGVMPMIGQSESGHSSATTKSGVSQGAITITSTADQKQEVASLNRDTSNLNGTVSKLPDVNTVLGNQIDVMNAATAAGEAVAKDVGTYADYKHNAVLDGEKAANALGDTDAAAQYKQDAADWAEGGADRVAMHIVAGAVLGGLGGGSFGSALGGAVGAGVSAALAPALNELSSSIANADLTGSATADRMLGQIVSNAVAGAAGAAVGGNAGAFTASNADMYNRQLHPTETQKLKQLQQGQSPDEQYRLAAAECALVHCADGVPASDPNKVILQQMQDAGQKLTNEQNLLKNAGAFDGYGKVDTIVDWADRNQVSNRAVGAVQGVGSAVAAAGAIGAGCATVVACSLGATVAVTSLDWSKAGFTQMVTGDVTPTYGQQALQSLGLSPQAAALAYTGLSLGAAGGAALANNSVQVTSNPSSTSNAARASNNFHRDDNLTTGLVPADAVNQQFIDQGYSAPFTRGTNVNVSTAGTGAPANMVVTNGQASAIAAGKPAVGAFSTPDVVPNQQYVRDTLAVTPAMKPDVSMVQPVQTTGKPMVTVEGQIAPQTPANQFPGGGNQTFYDYPAGGTRTDYVRPVGPAQPLPK
ncbi:filamentous hemagglutinin [Paraburkholderia steynii]|uniref:Filamentous hemagglutinin n=2 Tax=Paraburkholderia steynii TaxID=1245441 RepID=A0A7Z7BCB4_9BURK|nr:filamentous hemagglutinin [Paraburkholderia steynii]